MKVKNFPSRKMKRRIDAEKRAAGTAGAPYTAQEQARIDAAAAIRTKKDRSSTRPRLVT